MAGWQNDGKNISGTNNSQGESRNLKKKKGERKKRPTSCIFTNSSKSTVGVTDFSLSFYLFVIFQVFNFLLIILSHCTQKKKKSIITCMCLHRQINVGRGWGFGGWVGGRKFSMVWIVISEIQS